MNRNRYGKYPNKTDFDPNSHRPISADANYYELPLSDPSETLPADAYQAREIRSIDALIPSAFSVNRKKKLETIS